MNGSTNGDLRLALAHAILDRVLIGVGVVDAKLRVLYANAAARHECAHHPAVRIEAGSLVVGSPREHDELMRAMAAARTGRWSLVHVPTAGDASSLAVLPIAGGEPGLDADPPVLVVFGLRNQTRTLATEFYAQTHGMTHAETRVLRALGEGLSPRQIADRHAVALSTVRSQITSIRSRTGTRSILDLIHTLGHLPQIMPAAAA